MPRAMFAPSLGEIRAEEKPKMVSPLQLWASENAPLHYINNTTYVYHFVLVSAWAD
jgi:hypothetical protein